MILKPLGLFGDNSTVMRISVFEAARFRTLPVEVKTSVCQSYLIGNYTLFSSHVQSGGGGS